MELELKYTLKICPSKRDTHRLGFEAAAWYSLSHKNVFVLTVFNFSNSRCLFETILILSRACNVHNNLTVFKKFLASCKKNSEIMPLKSDVWCFVASQILKTVSYEISRLAGGMMAGFMAATSNDKWSTTVDYSSMAFVCEKPAGCKYSFMIFWNLAVTLLCVALRSNMCLQIEGRWFKSCAMINFFLLWSPRSRSLSISRNKTLSCAGKNTSLGVQLRILFWSNFGFLLFAWKQSCSHYGVSYLTIQDQGYLTQKQSFYTLLFFLQHSVSLRR